MAAPWPMWMCSSSPPLVAGGSPCRAGCRQRPASDPVPAPRCVRARSRTPLADRGRFRRRPCRRADSSRRWPCPPAAPPTRRRARRRKRRERALWTCGGVGPARLNSGLVQARRRWNRELNLYSGGHASSVWHNASLLRRRTTIGGLPLFSYYLALGTDFGAA